MSESNGSQLPAPVPAQQPPTGLVSASAALAERIIYCSLRPTTPVDRVRLYQALDGDAEGWPAAVNRRLRVEHVIITRGRERIAEDGTVTTPVVTTVITTEGEVIAGTSIGVSDSVLALAMAFGEPPWRGGLPLIVQSVAVKRGQMIKLALDRDVIDAEINACRPQTPKKK